MTDIGYQSVKLLVKRDMFWDRYKKGVVFWGKEKTKTAWSTLGLGLGWNLCGVEIANLLLVIFMKGHQFADAAAINNCWCCLQALEAANDGSFEVLYGRCWHSLASLPSKSNVCKL